MRKFLKNQKGFTLIELMMVIAVISILAAVLIPNMLNAKNNAKLAGMDTNVRQVQAAVIGLIERYQKNATAANFSSAVAHACKGIVDPFDTTKVDGAVASANNTMDTTVAVTVNKISGGSVPANADANAGMIFVKYTIASGAVKDVTITPYDNGGAAMAATTVSEVY